MNISREINNFLLFLFNDCLPPVIRDRKWFMEPFYRMLLGNKTALYRDFRRDVYRMSNQEFSRVNREAHEIAIQRDTDLNKACVEKILSTTAGPRVLEVGCGRGFLSKKLATRFDVTAVDMALDAHLKTQHPNIRFMEHDVENLPFEDGSFDTVISTHMLEHTRNIQGALKELRRVCKRQLIIVVPCERPYFYTFNLHIHFFPYEYSLLAVTGVCPHQILEKIDGDWFYEECYHE